MKATLQIINKKDNKVKATFYGVEKYKLKELRELSDSFNNKKYFTNIQYF